jgi:DNA-binding NtrC family response regulator
MCVAVAAASMSASTYRPNSIYSHPVTESPKTGKALLLGRPEDRTWEEYLRKAVEELDREPVLATGTAITEIPWGDYELVILDDSAVVELARVISQIRSLNPEARIIIFSSSPSWEQAREAMLAGAVDYAPRELRHKYILGVIRRALTKRIRDVRRQD